MDDAGLLHLATRMPQLLRVAVTGCSDVTPGGLSLARAATVGCASHRMVIDRARDSDSDSDDSDWNLEPDELEDYLSEDDNEIIWS